MKHAFTTAERGTCSRLQVGTVVALDGRILVTGYNGTPAGMPHCNHDCRCSMVVRSGHVEDCPAGKPCLTAVHAEANVVAYAARHGIMLNGAELYTTDTPCLNCAMLIINAGIITVFAAREYRDKSGTELLKQAGVEVNSHRWRSWPEELKLK